MKSATYRNVKFELISRQLKHDLIVVLPFQLRIHHKDAVKASTLISDGCKWLAAPPKTHLSNQTSHGFLSADSSWSLHQQIICFIRVCLFGTSSEESDGAPEDSDMWTGGARDPISNLVKSF